MTTKKREEGFYWVLAFDSWDISWWSGTRWLSGLHDDDFQEIDERRITRDGQERLVSLIKQARQEWLDHNDPKDGTDVVTPYDEVLYQ